MTEVEKELNRRADIIIRQEKQIKELQEIIKVFLKYEVCTLNIKDELADNIAKAEAFINKE